MARRPSKVAERDERVGLSSPETLTEDLSPDLSRAEYVYQKMRDGIRKGTYSQGARMREEDLANSLGVSRTPVREALRRLQTNGLLEIAPGRGLVVAELTKQQVLELYAVRELLEGSAARLAAQHASPSEIVALRQMNGALASAQDPKRSAHTNWTFHQWLYNAAHNRYLVQSLDRLSDSLALLPRTTYEMPGRTEEAAREHDAIIDAIEARDPDQAENAARRHIREAQRHRMHLLFDF